jgi:hypothetical protein
VGLYPIPLSAPKRQEGFPHADRREPEVCRTPT